MNIIDRVRITCGPSAQNEVVKDALVIDNPDGRAVEGSYFIVAEATGEEELVKSFRSAGDPSGSSYTLSRFYEDSVSFKRQIRRSSGGF